MNSSSSAQRSATLRRSRPDPNRPSDADLRPPEPLPQAPQSRYPPAADPGPVNPEDKRRLSVYPQLRLNPPPMSAHPAPRATPAIRAETAGSSGLALGPNQRGKAGGEVELRFRSWQWPASADEEGPAGEHGATSPRRLRLTHPGRKRMSPGRGSARGAAPRPKLGDSS